MVIGTTDHDPGTWGFASLGQWGTQRDRATASRSTRAHPRLSQTFPDFGPLISPTCPRLKRVTLSQLNQTSLKATAGPQRGTGDAIGRHPPLSSRGLPDPPSPSGIGGPENGDPVHANRDRGALGDRRPAASHSSHRSRVRRHRARRCHHGHGCRPCFPPLLLAGISISSLAAVTSDNRPAARASRVRRHIISSRVLEPVRSASVCRRGLTPMRRVRAAHDSKACPPLAGPQAIPSPSLA